MVPTWYLNTRWAQEPSHAYDHPHGDSITGYTSCIGSLQVVCFYRSTVALHINYNPGTLIEGLE